ncbi:hypothetical protein HPB52_024879 [Rhipicephalus sanguineus]|uniref:Uncharacterized protein n=1 Tax=Rhipicephalus sanguineus TaxID=34632 RepID=A0A9D4TDP9_RHISA|nr:hypothetical protein HPB52_024879 [Rhipicephalus sanguineus]
MLGWGKRSTPSGLDMSASGMSSPSKKDGRYWYGTLLRKSSYVFKPQLNQWLAIPPLPEPRNYHAIVYYAGCIYVIGGRGPVVGSKGGLGRAQRSVFKFHVREKRWERVADMLHARALHGATVVYEKIMVVGGKDDKEE